MTSRPPNSDRRTSSRAAFPSAALLTVALSLCVILAAFATRYWQKTTEKPGQPSATNVAARELPVNVMSAQLDQFHLERRQYTGLIKAQETVDLSFPREGRLANVLVDHGDAVEQGTLLASLEKRPLELKRDQLQLALNQARTALARTLADPRLQTATNLRASLNELQTELEQLKAQFAAEDSGTAADTVTGARLQAAQRNWETLDAVTRRQAETQQSVVEELQAELATVEAELEECDMVAPFDGTIALRHLNAASLVSPSRPVLRLVNPRQMQGWFAIPLTMINDFESGKSFSIQVANRELSANVDAVLPEVDRSTRAQTVILAFDETVSQLLTPGELCQLTLQRQIPGEGFWLPLAALTRQTRGLWSVFVVETDSDNLSRANRRFVEVLHLEGQRAWVRGMLSPGDRVIANGTHRIVEGQRVAPREAAATTPGDDAVEVAGP